MITIHAGHAPAGKKGCGAVGLLDESAENRKVLAYLRTYLDVAGIEFEDITCTEGDSPSAIINKLVTRANLVKSAALHVSIHLDSWTTASAKGTSVLYYPSSAMAFNAGKNVLEEVCAALGTADRGMKPRGDLGFLHRTAAPAILVECCFVTSPEDKLKWDPEACARGIARGIAKYLDIDIDSKLEEGTEIEETPRKYYRVQLGAFERKENAERLMKELISQGYDAMIKEV